MQSLAEIVTFIAGATLHDPRHFHWLMLASLGVLLSAGLLYAAYAARSGGGGLCGLLGGRRQPYVQLVETGDGDGTAGDCEGG